VLLFVSALALLAWAAWRGEWQLATPPGSQPPGQPPSLHLTSLVVGLGLAIIAFLSFYTLEFGFFNTTLLIAALFFVARAFWKPTGWLQRWITRGRDFLANPRLTLHLSGWTWPGWPGCSGDLLSVLPAR
jgi:hypothetical protein